MGYGLSIFLFAVGAILRFAVRDRIPDVNLDTIGLILMIAGAAVFLVTLFWTILWANRRRDRVATVDEYGRPVEYVERDPADPRYR